MPKLFRCKALLLLVLACLPVLASVYFLAATRIIEHRQQERLEAGLARTYRFPISAVVWVKAGKEIRVPQGLFDLIRFHTEGSVLVATGLWDREETALQQQLNRQPLTPADHPLNLQLLSVLFTPGLPATVLFLTGHAPETGRSYGCLAAPELTVGFRNILLPPPRVQPLT